MYVHVIGQPKGRSLLVMFTCVFNSVHRRGSLSGGGPPKKSHPRQSLADRTSPPDRDPLIRWLSGRDAASFLNVFLLSKVFLASPMYQSYLSALTKKQRKGWETKCLPTPKSENYIDPVVQNIEQIGHWTNIFWRGTHIMFRVILLRGMPAPNWREGVNLLLAKMSRKFHLGEGGVENTSR